MLLLCGCDDKDLGRAFGLGRAAGGEVGGGGGGWVRAHRVVSVGGRGRKIRGEKESVLCKKRGNKKGETWTSVQQQKEEYNFPSEKIYQVGKDEMIEGKYPRIA